MRVLGFLIGEMHYWHITSILTPYAEKLLPFFNSLDSMLTRIPLVQLMAWIFTFERIDYGINLRGGYDFSGICCHDPFIYYKSLVLTDSVVGKLSWLSKTN